jgi:hypothetical protein
VDSKQKSEKKKKEALADSTKGAKKMTSYFSVSELVKGET